MTPSREVTLAAVLARRERHRERPAIVRIGCATVGLVVLAVSLVVVVVAPEVGVPLMLWALNILSLEFDWAVRAHARVLWYWERLKAWFRSRGPVAKVILITATLAVVVVLIVALVSR